LFVTQIAKTHTSPLRDVYENLSHYTCADVANLAGRSSFVPIDDAVSLEVAISEIRFAGLERLVVLNPECELVGVLSQSCIVQFLSSSITKLDVSGKDIDSLKLGYREVPTVQETMLVSEAFKFLYQRGLDAVGVVNDRNELVANLSASDLRNAECESLEIFSSLSTLTVKKFMKKIGQKQITTVKPTDTVARVIKLFAKKKFHQIYVISNKGSTEELLGLIRLSDILDLVVHVLEMPW
jgi:CBS domain-containing protein